MRNKPHVIFVLILFVATFVGCTSQIASPPGSSSNPVVPTSTMTITGSVSGGASGIYHISAFTSTSNVNSGTYAGGTTANAGAFSFSVPAGGTYYLNIYRDTNSNGSFDSGEPAVWYGGGYYANTNPTAITTTTNVGAMTVISTFTVSGTITGGTSGTYYVSAFTDTSNFIWAGGTTGSVYSFFVPLTGANYYINAYRDTSGDGNYQGTEPSGWYGGTNATAIPVSNTTTGADFTVN